MLEFIQKEITQAIKEDRAFRWDELHLIGSRKSGKTFMVYGAIKEVCEQFDRETISCNLFRWRVGDTQFLIKDFINKTKKLGLKYWDTFNKDDWGARAFAINGQGEKRVVFKNGVEVRAYGLFNKADDEEEIANLGFKAGLQECITKYQINFKEEFSEWFLEKDMELNNAIRGAKYKLDIYASNPWDALSPYNQKIAKLYPQNETILINNGIQLKEVQDGNKKLLIVYSNVKANKYVWEDKKQIQEIDEYKDRFGLTAWKTARFGLFGYENSGVYTRKIDKIRDFSGYTYIMGNECGGGGDIGVGSCRGSGATCFLFTYFDRCGIFKVCDEFYIDFKNIDDINFDLLYKNVIDFYKRCMETYRTESGDTQQHIYNVYVDFSNKETIYHLNQLAKAQRINNLIFNMCEKDNITKRIEGFYHLCDDHRLEINKDKCKNLMRQLHIAKWEKNKITGKKQRKNKEEHSIDALEYFYNKKYHIIYDMKYIFSQRFDEKNGYFCKN